jgi:hypothetical protein
LNNKVLVAEIGVTLSQNVHKIFLYKLILNAIKKIVKINNKFFQYLKKNKFMKLEMFIIKEMIMEIVWKHA